MIGNKHYILIAWVVGLLVPAYGAMAQQTGMIQGRVLAAEGYPLENVVVSVADHSDLQDITNEEGHFNVSAEIGQHLIVRAEGYVPVRVAVDQKELTITLRDDARTAAVGYGMARSRDALTSAVGAAGAAELAKRSVINPANALYGLIPGLMVLQNGGRPPTSPTLFVRGRGTLTSSAPLVLVDGLQRPFSSVSLAAIERVTVLKDAAALAKYGQRGANGVILITTKRGRRGGLAVNASFEMGVTRPTALPNLLNAPAYARALNEARVNDGLDPRYAPTEVQAFASGTHPYLYPNVNWFDRVLRDHGLYSNFNISFRGGGQRARYFSTLSYVNESGLFGPVERNDGYSTQLNYRRLNFRANLDVDVTDDLLFQFDVAARLVENNLPSGGNGASHIFSSMYTIPSAAFPVKTPEGSWGGTQIYDSNPMAVLTATGYGQPNSRAYSLTGRLKQDLSMWVKGLRATAALSYYSFGSFHERKGQSFSYIAMLPVRNQAGQIIDTTMTRYGQDTDLEFSDSFGNKRKFTDALGKITYERMGDAYSLQATALFHQASHVFDGQDNTYHRRNIVGNVHIGLSGTYFFDVTLSYSGNNLLPPGGRYGLFPAMSAAVLLGDDDFLEWASFLDRLKVQASWGMSGSARLPSNNPYKQTYTPGGGGYWWRAANKHRGGFLEGRLGAAEFTYETSYMMNFGLEATLLERLEVSANLFYSRRTDILVDTGGQFSEVLGVAPPRSSDGIVDNAGVEAALRWAGTIGAVDYHLGGTFTYARNTIVEMNEPFFPYDYLRRTGRQVGQRFGLEAIGFFKSEQDIANSPEQVFEDVQPGDIEYKDQNGDGVINEFDVVPLGYASGYPEIYFSGLIGFSYKGLSVSALFQGTGHYTAYLNTPSVFWPLRRNNTISAYYYERRWTSETAASATFPRLTAEVNDNNFRPNSLWLVDRSYLKLRTLEVSYALPESLIEQWQIDGVRIYVRGMNLFSIDDIPVLDPEYLGTGYPLLRSYVAGLELSF